MRVVIATILALSGSSALAADMVDYVPSPPVATAAPSVYDWTGFYAGGVAGYGWGDSDMRQIDPSPDLVDINGFLLGGTIGYNVSFDSPFGMSSPLVVGLEGDLAYSTVDGSFGPGVLPGGFNCGSGPCTTELDWLATARGRVGFAFDRLLVFGSGGVAWGNVKSQVVNNPNFVVSDTSVGWTAGGGIEYAFTDRWSAKLEYLYVDLGETAAAPNNFRTDNQLNVIRTGINWHF